MDTKIESPRNNNFIYALGLFCLLNILSSEISQSQSKVEKNDEQIQIVSDCKEPSYFII